jgi:hypothetical protein
VRHGPACSVEGPPAPTSFNQGTDLRATAATNEWGGKNRTEKI